MDLWGVQMKNASTSPLWALTMKKRINCSSPQKLGSLRIKILRKNISSSSSKSSNRYLVVRAIAKKNGNTNNNNNDNDNTNNSSSSPGGNGSNGINSSEGKKPNDIPYQKSQHVDPDWRKVRATLIQMEMAEANAHSQGGTVQKPMPLGHKWAHPLSAPENGCVLVATEKLDGAGTFERTVVLLLRSGTRHPQEGPFGVVINRPLDKKIRHMKPSNNELATTFADCSLHFGGPLEASMFLLKAGEKSKLPGFEEVIPGLCFGARNSLDEAAALVKKGVLKPQDFRFFVGYAGWQLDQLREEIESDYWYVAACSLDLICGGASGTSSESLWEEILQQMGGHYSELSRKPKQDM